MFLYQQSEATAAQRRVFLHLVDATDGITPETGEAAGQPQLSKNGAAFGNTTATLTAVGNGLYYVELTAAELDTLAMAAVRYKSANTAEAQVLIQIVPWDPYSAVSLGLTNLDATVSSRLAPTVAARTLDVSVGGEAGLDWANIGSPTTAQNLSATNIDVDQIVASVSGAVGSVTGAVGSVAAGGITAASFAANAITATVIANGAIDAATFAAGAIDATAIATGAIDADALAADAVAEIADGVWDEDATGHQTQGTFGQAIGDPVADTNTIYKAVVTDAAGATVGIDVVAVQADTDNIQTRLPAALVGGRMDSSVGAMAAGVITAAAIATDAIDADALAADAIAEIQSGLATSAALATVQADTDNIQTRLPAALVGGRMDASVGDMQASGLADFFTVNSGETFASAVAGSVVKEIADNAGGSSLTVQDIVDGVWDEPLAAHVTAATMGFNQNQIDNILADTDDIQTRLPAALVGGRMDSSVGAMAANVITAASIATDAIDADAIAADAVTEIQAGLATTAQLVSEINAVQADIAALNNLSAGQVNSEIVDALSVDTYAEPTGVPPATDTIANKLGRLHQALRNRIDVDSNTGKKQFFDDANAALWEKDFTDAGNIYSESEGNAP